MPHSTLQCRLRFLVLLAATMLSDFRNDDLPGLTLLTGNQGIRLYAG